MRVLHVITTLSVGGAETMLRNVALGLPRARFEQRVISLTTREPIGGELESAGIPVLALEGRGGLLLPGQIASARRLVGGWQPDLIHTWMYHSNLVGRMILGAAPRRPTFIASVRGALNSPGAQKRALRLVRWLDARASREADAILFNSRASAEQHQAIGYDRGKTIIIPNGFDTRLFKPNPEARARARIELAAGDTPLIGLVARYDPVKGHSVLLRAVAQVIAAGQRCRAVLVGRNCDSRNSELMQLIAMLGIGDAVTLLGERRDIPELLGAFDFAVCPSVSESFPNAIGEAMACALPCVVADVGDCAYLVGDTGLVAPPADTRAFARRLIELLDLDCAARTVLGERARQRIEAHFSLDGVVRRYGELYESLLARAT